MTAAAQFAGTILSAMPGKINPAYLWLYRLGSLLLMSWTPTHSPKSQDCCIHCAHHHISYSVFLNFRKLETIDHKHDDLVIDNDMQVLIEEGGRAEEGDPVIVLEAMKMEHTVKAPCSGTVTDLRCFVGAQVEDGHVLATVLPTVAA